MSSEWSFIPKISNNSSSGVKELSFFEFTVSELCLWLSGSFNLDLTEFVFFELVLLKLFSVKFVLSKLVFLELDLLKLESLWYDLRTFCELLSIFVYEEDGNKHYSADIAFRVSEYAEETREYLHR